MAYIRRGIGDYEGAANAPTWPYSPNSSQDPSRPPWALMKNGTWNQQPQKPGGCGCGCSGGGTGMGLFDSMDPTTWGVGEYATLGIAGYLALKLAGDTKKVGRKVRGSKAAAGGFGFVGALALAGGAYYLWNKSQTTTTASGVGDYMAQGYTGPQQLQAPLANADILIPAGW